MAEEIQTIILAGGMGTRIQSVAGDLPKSMIPVAGRPFIEHQLELLRVNGLSQVLLLTGYRGELIQQHAGPQSGQQTSTQEINITNSQTNVTTSTLIQHILIQTLKTPSITNINWPEITVEKTDIEQSFGGYDPNIGDDFVDSTVINITENTIHTENTFHMEFPVFCEWATIVCDFINWFWEDNPPPENPELPTEEPDVWEEWDSGMPSTGSCPAPRVTEYMGTQITIPFDDFCYGLSTYFRPIFIALAMFAAGFILVGARQ